MFLDFSALLKVTPAMPALHLPRMKSFLRPTLLLITNQKREHESGTEMLPKHAINAGVLFLKWP